MELITAITIAYIVTVATVALVATVVVLRDIAKSKQDQPVQTIQLVAPNPVASTEEASETKVEEPIEEPVSEEQEGDVTFSTEKRTLDEKYLELSAEYKGYYDELVRYAMSFEGSRRYKTANHEEYKVSRRRLVKIKIKREIIVCELLVPNLDFKNFISENKVEAKQQSTVINVTDEQSLEAVKGCIAIAYQEIEEELAYKKEQARIRRLEKRKEARLLAKTANETEETVVTSNSDEKTEIAEEIVSKENESTEENEMQEQEIVENSESTVESEEKSEETAEGETETAN